MEKTYTLNAAPSLTWNWLKSNCDQVTVNAQFVSEEGKYSSLPSGIKNVSDFNTGNFHEISAITNVPNKKFGDIAKTAQNARITTAAKQTNEDFSALINQTVKNPQNFLISGNVSEPMILTFDAAENSISVQNIIASENSEVTIICLYQNDSETSAVNYQLTRIIAKENAKVHLIKIQLLGNSTTQMDDTRIFQEANSSVKFTQLELGGLHIDSGLYTELKGYKSSFKSEVAYLCKQNQFLDMNHLVYHYGQKTECDMQVNGTIKDNAVKSYRGTIDFKNGCCGSKGNEMEQTLLLSPEAVNKSLPVILCDEEDVEGEHGATIGRLSSDILFYMQSRGIDEKQAEKIMSKAKIQAVADKIPVEKIKNTIYEYLDKNI